LSYVEIRYTPKNLLKKKLTWQNPFLDKKGKTKKKKSKETQEKKTYWKEDSNFNT